MRAAMLLTLASLSTALAGHVSYDGPPPRPGVFFHEADLATQNATRALDALLADDADGARLAAQRVSALARELDEAAPLPLEETPRADAAAQANATRLLDAALGRLVDAALREGLPIQQLSPEAARDLLARAAALHEPADALRALGHATGPLDAATRGVESALRNLVTEQGLLVVPSRGALGAGHTVRIVALGASPPAEVTVLLADLPPVRAPFGADGAALARIDVPLDAALLGAQIVSAQADAPGGTTLRAEASVVVERHPTRILVREGRPTLASALDAAPPPALAAALAQAEVVAEGPAPFDPARPAVLVFHGTGVLAPAQRRHVPPPQGAPTDALAGVLAHPLALGAVALLVVGAGAAWLLRGPRAAPWPEPSSDRQVVHAPEDPHAPVDPSAAGASPAERVVHLYAAVRGLAHRAGLGSAAQTPREWASGAAARLGADDTRALVSAYEQARFGLFPPGEDASRRALDAARRLLDALGRPA